MTFPALFDIGHRKFVGDDEDDEHGNPLQGWSDPIPKKVIYVGPVTDSGFNSSENNSAGSQVTIDLEVGVPVDFGDVDPRDRMVYKGVEYEVVGAKVDLSGNPFQVHFGDYLQMRRVDG